MRVMVVSCFDTPTFTCPNVSWAKAFGPMPAPASAAARFPTPRARAPGVRVSRTSGTGPDRVGSPPSRFVRSPGRGRRVTPSQPAQSGITAAGATPGMSSGGGMWTTPPWRRTRTAAASSRFPARARSVGAAGPRVRHRHDRHRVGGQTSCDAAATRRTNPTLRPLRHLCGLSPTPARGSPAPRSCGADSPGLAAPGSRDPARPPHRPGSGAGPPSPLRPGRSATHRTGAPRPR